MITSSALADLGDGGDQVVEAPRRVERVDARPQLRVGVVPGLADLDQPGAGVLLLRRRHGVFEVGQQHVDGRRDVRHLADHLRVVGRQEVDHPRRPERDVPHRLRGTDRQRAEEVLRGTHARQAYGSRPRRRGETAGLADCASPTAAPARFAPLWVYLFGLFAVAVLQRVAVPAGRAPRGVQRGVLRRRRRRRRRRPHDRRAPTPPPLTPSEYAGAVRVRACGGSPAGVLRARARCQGRWSGLAGADDEAVGDEAGDDAGVERGGRARTVVRGPAARRRGPGGRCPRTAPGGC